jgi:hypothetical protein
VGSLARSSTSRAAGAGPSGVPLALLAQGSTITHRGPWSRF